MRTNIRRLADHGRRPPLDRTAVRYFVYTLTDTNGDAVYVGRSCNPRQRIMAHAAEARWHADKAWVFDVRNVDLSGPYTWDGAVTAERDTIERLQPRANRDLTARDRRPAVAARSAARSQS